MSAAWRSSDVPASPGAAGEVPGVPGVSGSGPMPGTPLKSWRHLFLSIFPLCTLYFHCYLLAYPTRTLRLPCCCLEHV